MVNLIINEIRKIKIIKIIFIILLYIVSLILINKNSNNSIYDMSYSLIPFIGIFLCLLFSGSICLEIDNGSMRYYLTKPFKRYKIYLSKLITILLFVFISYIVITIITCIIGNSFNNKYFLKFFINCIPIIFMSSFILYLSIKFKNHVFVSILSILILCFSIIVSQVLFGIRFNIVEYTFLPYLDFSIFRDKTAILEMNKELGIHLSLNRGIVINLVYFLLFIVNGLVIFNKKDIKS